MPSFLPLVNKARKPKFELHLSIYDLNNVPLASGAATVKWHLPPSMHGDHRGRTAKCPIDAAHHRVSFHYSKVVPLRITIDRNNNLTECPIEFEVAQEFPAAAGQPGARDEKITLGVVRLNLSEYVEESEHLPRRSIASRPGASLDQPRDRAASNPTTATTTAQRARRTSHGTTDSTSPPRPADGPESAAAAPPDDDVPAEEGIVRRYLMQESKINSTLKIGILMVQVDGERNYVAPPLKSAAMFGGIAGIMAGGGGDTAAAAAVEPADDAPLGPGGVPNTNSGGGNAANPGKARDASELQDMYRRSLAASWSCQPGELPAEECIEDIFGGGTGWKASSSSSNNPSKGGGSRGSRRGRLGPAGHHRGHDGDESSGNFSGDEAAGGTLRPSGLQGSRAHMQRRNRSASSGKSNTLTLTTTGGGGGGRDKSTGPPGGLGIRHGGGGGQQHKGHWGRRGSRDESAGQNAYYDATSNGGGLARTDSLTSLAPTLGSLADEGDERDGNRLRRPCEVDEFEVRDDLVSWALPETVA